MGDFPQTRSLGGVISRLLPVLVFSVAAFVLPDKYLTPTFNSEMIRDPQKLLELMIFYYGLLSVPVAWSVFPRTIGEPRFHSYYSILIFSCFLVSARVATYAGVPYAGIKIINVLCGAILLFTLREILVPTRKDPSKNGASPVTIFQYQIGSAFAFFGSIVIVELVMLRYSGASLGIPYVTSGFWGLLSLVLGLSALRSYLAEFDRESLLPYLSSTRVRMKKMEKTEVTRFILVSTILVAHVLYVNSFHNELAYAVIDYGLVSLLPPSILVASALNAIGLALLLAYFYTPFWFNRFSRNMTKEQIDSILEIKSIEATPLLLQNLISAFTFGLIKIEFFLIIPMAIFNVPRYGLLSFPNEDYILAVTVIFLVFGKLLLRHVNRSYFLYSMAIIAAPVSPLFSASLDFFHTDLKRRMLRHYAVLNEQLPSIVKKLQEAATKPKERLLIRLIAFYGFTVWELIGGKGLVGIRPIDFDKIKRSLTLHFINRTSKALDQLSVPLDDITAELMEESVKGNPENQRIFALSRLKVHFVIWILARRAGLPNPNEITPFRLGAHFMIYAWKNLPHDVFEELRSKKAF